MNNQEAKLILGAYRPSGEDAADPLMAEALEQARRDPELGKWLAEEQALDIRIQAQLRSALVPPPELKSNLLALQRVAPPASWRLRPIWLAAAASVALLLGLAAFWLQRRNPPRFDSFRQAMVRYSSQEDEHITFKASDTAAIRQWLQDRGLNPGFDFPPGLRGRPAKGCRVVAWNGQKVALICFVLADGSHVDLFVMDRAGFPSLAGDGAAQFARAGPWMTAAWTKDDRVYLLTGGGDAALLQKLLRES